MASTTDFNPFTQSFTLLEADGATNFNVSISTLDSIYQYSVRICINYSVQLGASLALLLVLLLLAQPEKRRSPIFLINLVSLALNVIRLLLQCLFFTGNFTESYAFLAGDYSRVTNADYANQIVSAIMNVLLLISVEISLCLQVRALCSSMILPLYRRIIFGLSAIIVFLALGFRLALCVENVRYILTVSPTLTNINWLQSASNITTTISICWFCVIFVGMLGIAIYRRQQMGLKKFGPVHVIFIMGCQTLIIPAIFSIIQYYTSIPAMSSNVLTLVTVFLPLSSLWAAKTTTSIVTKHHRPTSPLPSSPPPGFHAKQVFSSSTSLLFTESDRVENCAPVNRMNHGESVASSLGLADGHHAVFALQDLEKQDLR
ncbi:hypothetical protein MMC31_002874 [Peltigera leucophlebia]|nr:hypothetical protein [Peltigera leucophlebia]